MGIDSDPKDFILKDDGNLVVYDECGETLWESKTSGKCNVIPGNVVIQRYSKIFVFTGWRSLFFFIVNLILD